VNDHQAPDQDERNWLDRLTHFLNGRPQSKSDLEGVLSLAANNEVIDEDARSIMEGALNVSDMQVRDIMIPRAQMVVIKAESDLGESLPQIIHAAHSRYPVVGDSTDDILGMLLAKDLLPLVLKSDRGISIKDLMRPIVKVPESKRLNVLLREFRQNRHHMAVVIDEYGGVAGLVTIEDVLEEIVGEIEDETDTEEEQNIRRLSDTDYFVQALTPIEDFNTFFGCALSDDEFDTIGGLVINAFGHLPSRNETTTLAGFKINVVNADRRKLHSVRVTPLEQN
jgi:magnesium and cobalt transporter